MIIMFDDDLRYEIEELRNEMANTRADIDDFRKLLENYRLPIERGEQPNDFDREHEERFGSSE